jgi:hypothetical protein
VKRILSVVLIMIILAGTGGMYYSFRLSLYLNQLAVKSILRDKSEKTLTLLIINPEQSRYIHWKKQGREFEYKGHLYDISSSAIINGVTYYSVYRDEAEKKLVSEFKHKRSLDHPINKILVKILISNYIIPASRTEIIPVIHEFRYTYFENNPLILYSDIHSPPPKGTC